jgi:hypothetical protein
MNSRNIVQIPVRMGSNRFNFEVLLSEDKTHVLRSGKFIELVLRKSNLSGTKYLPRTYSVFESSCGIERMLTRSDDLVQIWRAHKENNSNVEFVIRKCNLVEKKLAVNVKTHIDANNNCSSESANSKIVRKCYKKLNALKVSDASNANNSAAHIYEHVEDVLEKTEQLKASQSQEAYLQQIAKNEMKLMQQSQKLIQVEKSIQELYQKKQQVQELPQSDFNELKLTQNINVLRYLYTKLRSQSGPKVQKAFYRSSKLNESRVALLSHDYNSCGNSTDESESKSSSGKSSRSNSSSALESLV